MKTKTVNITIFLFIYFGGLVVCNLVLLYLFGNISTADYFGPFPGYAKTVENVQYYTIDGHFDLKSFGNILNGVLFVISLYLVFVKKLKLSYWAVLFFTFSLLVIKYFMNVRV